MEQRTVGERVGGRWRGGGEKKEQWEKKKVAEKHQRYFDCPENGSEIRSQKQLDRLCSF